MSEIPEELLYTRSHEWVRRESDGSLTLGITDHAQESLGDLVFVDVPKEGESLDAGSECAVVESVKAASDIYAPVAGEILAVNEALEDHPEYVNEDPYGDGWILQLTPAAKDGLDELLSPRDYADFVEEEEND
jgi:glycine cleavage system H protein